MNEILKNPKKKLLLGLVIVGMLLVFVGVGFSSDEPANANKSGTPQTAQAPTAPAPVPVAKPAAPAPDALTPNLSCDFVKWWATKSMEYTPAAARASHVEAFRWMTPEAAQAFQACFWTPAIEQEILTGHVVAAFQPVSVQAEAINPDGSIVVGLTGTLVMQAAGTPPVTQQIAVDYLVSKDAQGLRICNLYNRTTLAPAAAQ